jgi:DNA-directed RNA polymerase subunit RPC12/RpoP
MLPPIKAISVACQNCGSPLKLAEGLRFVTCNYCASELEIVRDESSTHSVVLKRLEAKMDATDRRLRLMEARLDLERLEQEWGKSKEVYMIRGKNGDFYEPGGIATYLTIILLLTGGAVSIGNHFANISSTQPTLPFFGILLLCVGGFKLVNTKFKQRAMSDAQQHYQHRRWQLMNLMRELED